MATSHTSGGLNVLISGMGIAGPTLAWWLKRYGHTPVVVERAPALRTGGYVIDFWGQGYDVAERMGLAPHLNEIGYHITDVRIEDSGRRRAGGFSAEVFSRATNNRYVSLARGDLSAALYGALEDVETLWGTEIAALEEDEAGVAATFRASAHGQSGDQAPAPPEARRFDLAIGCDGLHSHVRELVFGPENQFERFLGYKVAAFEATGYPLRDEDVYVSFSAPGKQLARFSMRGDRTLFLFVFRETSPELPHGAAARAVLHREFGGLGWECDDILARLTDDAELYFDRVSQIEMPAFTKGRTALVGDAAGCPSLLAGEGSAMAMIGAYVLAGDLHRAGGDHARAFAAYEARMAPFIREKQDAARKFAASFAPRTRTGIQVRNFVTHFLGIPALADLFLGGSLKDNLDLPDFEAG
ncbi:MAG: FAD-binding domain [Hyphomonadaceae bacterium]